MGDPISKTVKIRKSDLAFFMKKNSKAFTLIKNMDMSEKRYFSIFSERHAEANKSLILFGILDGLNTENDIEIKKLLVAKGQTSNYLAADKNYLYNQILRALQVFHHSKSITIYQFEKLQQIELLYEKGLYGLCIYEAEKTLEHAEKYENFSLKIEVLTWLRRAIGYSKGLMSAYAINKQIKQSNELLANQIAYTDLYYESLKIKFSGFKARDSKQIILFNELLKNPLMKNKKLALSILARLRYHLVFANYYYVIGDQQKELEHHKITLQEMEDSGYYHLENPFDYIYVFNFYLNLLKDIKSPLFYKELIRFKSFSDLVKVSKEKSEIQIFHFSALAELNMMLESGRYADCIEIIPDIETKLKRHLERIEPAIQIHLWYLFAYVNFKVKKFNKAIKYVNHIINNYNEADREDIYNLSKVFQVILHFEINHADFLEYQVSKVIKELKKRGKLYQTEMLVLSVLKKAPALTEEAKAKKFSELYRNLMDFKSDLYEESANKIFDFSGWCKEKISKFSMN